MTRVCVVGSVNMDIGFDVDTLPRPGETALASSLRSTPGGKGANQAVAAARAGAHVQFVGAVGDDAAAAPLREHLYANGVGTDGLITVPGPSGNAIVIVDSGGENIIVVAPGANGQLTLDSAALRRLVADCDVLLPQLEIPLATATAAAREAHSAGVTVMLNASPSGGDESGAGRAGGADRCAGRQRNRSRALGLAGPASVTTLGARGARYAGDGRSSLVPAPAVDATRHFRRRRRVRRCPGGRLDRSTAIMPLRRACAAGALATLVSGAGDCAPYAEAIDDATLPG